MTSKETRNAEPPLARALRRMIDLSGGLAPTAVELGISREAIARYLARLGLQPGTRERLERKVREYTGGARLPSAKGEP